MAAVKPTAPKSYTTVDPYQQYKNAYAAQQKAVTAANDAQVLERQNRENQAQQTLEGSNRMVNTSYVRANSPQNRFQQQNNFSSGVSDYLKGANYNTMLKGLGANQANYTQEMNNSNSLWQNWLAEKAGQEAQNAGDYADKMAAQSNADRTFNYNKYRDAMSDYQTDRAYDRSVYESDRDYKYQVGRDKVLDARDLRDFNYQKSVDDRNYNYQIGRDKIEDARYDKEWAYKTKGSSGGGGGYYRSGGGGGSEIIDDTSGNGWFEENGYAVEYKNGKPTGKKIKSNTSGGGANNTTKATNITPKGGKGGASKGVKTKTKQTYKKSYNTKTNKGNQVYRNYF